MNAHDILPSDSESSTSGPTTATRTPSENNTTAPSSGEDIYNNIIDRSDSNENNEENETETRVSIGECISTHCDETSRMFSFSFLSGVASFIVCVTFGIILLSQFDGEHTQEIKLNDIAKNLDCDLHKSVGDFGSQYYFTCSGPNNRTNENLAVQQAHDYQAHNQSILTGGLILTIVGGLLGPYAGCGIGLLIYFMLDNLIERLPSLPRLSLPSLPSLPSINFPSVRTLFNTALAMSNNYNPQQDEQSVRTRSGAEQPDNTDVETPTTPPGPGGVGA